MTEPTHTTHENQTESSSPEEHPLEMQVSVERLSDVERKLAIEIAWPEVKNRLDDAYRELQHGVALKGFRRGKVPRKMLEQLFGKHVTQEVSQRLVQDSVHRALTQQGLSAIAEPKVVDTGIKEGESFSYSATVEVLPEIEPKDYFGVELKQRPAKVTDQDVEVALRMKQREMTDFRTIEGRSTAAGDVLLVDLIGKLDDEPFDREGVLVELGDQPEEPLPGLAQKLTGISCEQEELQLELDVPQPGEAAAPPRRARLLVTIKDRKQKVVPAIDDDFARDTGEAQTLAELREVLRKKLLEQDEARARDEAKVQLLQELTRRNNVPLVPALVERQLDSTVRSQLAMLGIDPSSPHIELDSLKERMREDAVEAVKSGLLLDAISKKEQIEVQEADLERKLAEIASTRAQNVARVRSEYEKEGRMAALRARLREDKTLDLLMSKANIIVEEIAGTPTPGAESPEQGAR